MAPKTDSASFAGLRELVADIGRAHGGKTLAQVALNWAMRKASSVAVPPRVDTQTSAAEGWGTPSGPSERLYCQRIIHRI